MSNITYLLGAGASRYAFPILKEQGEKMLLLAKSNLPAEEQNFLAPKPRKLERKKEILWDIGYFGTKAIKYGTIDTYAKKLHFNNSDDELSRLKMTVSIFFTIWQLIEDKGIKYFNNSRDIIYDEIDKRYITLLASILEKDNSTLKLKDNIKFVSWNYDLQIELAYKAFCHDNISWDLISQNLKFRINGNDYSTQICHLNGYHGFYDVRGKEYNFMDISDSKTIDNILDSFEFISESRKKKELDFMNHINYAWEINERANKTREHAKNIFDSTDILIVIGYSFPNFNKDVDKELFNRLKGRKTKIYYQDPNANELFLSELVDSEDAEIICQKDKLDYFILPYQF